MDHELPNLSVHQLLYVREAARAPTWTEAARRLGVSQSALSQGVAEVERRLDVTLFDRRGRHRLGTQELQAVLPIAEQVLAATDDLTRHLDELATGRRGIVRIGMIDTAALGTLAGPLALFRAQNPEVRTTLVVESSVPLAEKVATGTLDLAVAVVPNPVIDANPTRFDVRIVAEEPIHVYAPTAKEAQADPTRWGPWVSYPHGSQTRRLIEQALIARGVTPSVVAESSNPDVLRQMVRLGVGWCAMPRDVAEAGIDAASTPTTSNDQPGMCRVSGPPLTHRTIALVRRRDALPNGAVEALVELITQTNQGASVKRPKATRGRPA